MLVCLCISSHWRRLAHDDDDDDEALVEASVWLALLDPGDPRALGLVGAGHGGRTK